MAKRSLRSRFFRLLLGAALCVSLGVVAVETANSQWILNSKTYELVGYSEVKREQFGSEIHILKSKRFGFLPGEQQVVFVQDAAGLTIGRKPVSVNIPRLEESPNAVVSSDLKTVSKKD